MMTDVMQRQKTGKGYAVIVTVMIPRETAKLDRQRLLIHLG